MATKYDVVLWGATGFTGRLVAAYLAKRAPPLGLSWAIAGRNADRLRAVGAACAAATGGPAPPALVGDGTDAASVARVVRRARVVLSTAGPFVRHSRPVVDACVALGADYVDINGETPYVRQLLDAGYHELAAAKGVYVVPNCGFDSVPSDLGCLLAVEALRGNDASAGIRRVRGYATMAGRLSGGTLESGLLMDTMGFSDQMKDPFLLGGKEGGDPAESRDLDGHRFDDEAGSWVAPFMMAQINTRVVRRSSELLGYGPNFTYNEAALAPTERAAKKIARQARTSVEKRVALRDAGVLPRPGEGPDAATRAKSSFRLEFVAEADDGARCRAVVAGGDPGYDETAKMCAEAAILLATERAGLAERRGGGVLTPAAAFGGRLTRALREAGIRFEVAPLPPRSRL